MRRTFLTIAGLALLAGCTPMNFQPTQNATGPQGMVQGQCKMVAMGMQQPTGGVYASGSPAFVGATVGAAVVAGAIGSAVRQQALYSACMEANGFVAVAPQQPHS